MADNFKTSSIDEQEWIEKNIDFNHPFLTPIQQAAEWVKTHYTEEYLHRVKMYNAVENFITDRLSFLCEDVTEDLLSDLADFRDEGF